MEDGGLCLQVVEVVVVLGGYCWWWWIVFNLTARGGDGGNGGDGELVDGGRVSDLSCSCW